jgi:predicted GTPase
MLPIWKKTDASDKTATVQIDSFKQISKIVGANTPLYVITVVGEYHTGKSSLNNALADENVFEVASDIPPQTQGFEVVVLKDDCKDVEDELRQQYEYCDALLATLRAKDVATKAASNANMAKVGSFNLNVNGESVGLAERDAATKAAKDAETRSNDALKNVKIAEKNQNVKKKYLSPASAAAFASLTTITAVEKEKQVVKARLTAKTKECEVVRPAIVLCDTPGT